jgi:hypothetical protein
VKKTAAIASLALGASLLVNAASPGASPQASLKASTNEQLLERIEAEVAFARGLAGLTPARAPVEPPSPGRDIVGREGGRQRGDPAAEVVKAETELDVAPAETVAVANDTFRTCTEPDISLMNGCSVVL